MATRLLPCSKYSTRSKTLSFVTITLKSHLTSLRYSSLLQQILLRQSLVPCGIEWKSFFFPDTQKVKRSRSRKGISFRGRYAKIVSAKTKWNSRMNRCGRSFVNIRGRQAFEIWNEK